MSKDGINSKDFLIGTLIGELSARQRRCFWRLNQVRSCATISAVRLLR